MLLALRRLSSRLTVVLTALLMMAPAGLIATASADAHATSAGQPVRPVVRGKPVLTFDPNDLGAGLAAYVRFDREVPRRASGEPLVRVSINISDSAPTLEPLITAGRRERACYTNLRLEDSPARPRNRMLVKLLVDVGPRNAFKRYRFSVRVERLTPAPTRPSNNPILRRLGCVRG